MPDNEVEVRPLEVHEAVMLAKTWLFNTYADENISNVGLEEVDYDEILDKWKITLGFSRPWDQNKNLAAVLNGAGTSGRVFKVVTVDGRDKKVISLRNRSSSP